MAVGMCLSTCWGEGSVTYVCFQPWPCFLSSQWPAHPSSLPSHASCLPLLPPARPSVFSRSALCAWHSWQARGSESGGKRGKSTRRNGKRRRRGMRSAATDRRQPREKLRRRQALARAEASTSQRTVVQVTAASRGTNVVSMADTSRSNGGRRARRLGGVIALDLVVVVVAVAVVQPWR